MTIMKIIKDLKKTVSKMSIEAKKTIDTTKVDIKIKSYNKQNEHVYNKLGKLIYNCKVNNVPVSTDELDKLCKEIDTLNGKIKNLEKQIVTIKQNANTKHENVVNDNKQAINYATLNKKENDLKILRTAEGIKFFKFCPQCNAGNNPESTVCVNCGHGFK